MWERKVPKVRNGIISFKLQKQKKIYFLKFDSFFHPLNDYYLGDPFKRIFISQIKEVLNGQQTEVLIALKSGEKLASKKNRFKSKNVEITDGISFSIIFKDHSNPLDLLADDADTVNKWVDIFSLE